MKLRTLQLLFTATLAGAPCLAEAGYVTVQVWDPNQHPVRLVEIEIEKNGGSKLTKDDGMAQLPLAKGVNPTDWITFHLVHSPPGKDLEIVSPWDYRSPIPSFADKAENIVNIVVVQKGDRAALESGMVLISLVNKINKANAPKTANTQTPPPDPKEALNAVAKQYGLSAEDIDTAIRAWGTKTNDDEERGIILLYEGNYPKASAALTDSLQRQEKQLEAAQEIVSQKQKGIADTAFFLGQSLYEQGKYRESADAYQKCLTYRPDDAATLNNLALSLYHSGDLVTAKPLYEQALALNEKTLGPDDPTVASSLANLASLLLGEGDLNGAEPFMRRALAIDEKAFGPDDPSIAMDLNNLGELLVNKGDLNAAEPLLRRALGIDEKASGSDSPDVALDLDNLAVLLQNKASLLQDKEGFKAAEPLMRRALAIDEKVLGTNHPTVAKDLELLASLLQEKGDLAAAERLEHRALGIDEKVLGPDHPAVARDLDNLASLLRDRGNIAAAESLERRAVSIDEKALGSDNPTVAWRLSNLAVLMVEKGDLAAAEPLLSRALAIDERALGSDHPLTKKIRDNLQNLQNSLAPHPQ